MNPILINNYHFELYSSASTLPQNWDELAKSNIFLSEKYIEILEVSKPENMQCFYIGIFEKEELIGIAIAQYLNLNQLPTFTTQDGCLKSSIKRFLFQHFSSQVLFIGNNMLTGQNAFSFKSNIDKKTTLHSLQLAALEIKRKLKLQGNKTHIITFKDFETNSLSDFETTNFQKNYRFSTQPNMVFDIAEHWKSEQDYIDALSKKYRDQYKRARKKLGGIEKRKMNLDDILKHEQKIYALYLHVAQNAPFNTFYLAKNHFSVFKEKLGHDFLFYGYFLNNELVGFNTLIKNGLVLDTYFLGYDSTIQQQKMLYLNMLYDMIAYSINKGFKKIIFARTALEIKSSVGAKPIEMFGFMDHQIKFLNTQMHFFFDYFEPKTQWNERNPFK
mgnify:FL=1